MISWQEGIDRAGRDMQEGIDSAGRDKVVQEGIDSKRWIDGEEDGWIGEVY